VKSSGIFKITFNNVFIVNASYHCDSIFMCLLELDCWMVLDKKLPAPLSKFLVYTCAGHESNLSRWRKSRDDFDLFVVYYGDQTGQYFHESDYYISQKGGKFPNFYKVYSQWRKIFDSYQVVMIADDDLIFTSSNLSVFFKIFETYNLSLAQPSFDPRGKASHRVGKVRPFSLMRYTNFVEVTCPAFDSYSLALFMSVYDPELNCQGVDYWFSGLIAKVKKRIAIVDAVVCLNPRDETKINGREIDTLFDSEERERQWQIAVGKYQLEEIIPVTFSSERYPISFRAFYLMCRHLFFKLEAQLNKLIRRKLVLPLNRYLDKK